MHKSRGIAVMSYLRLFKITKEERWRCKEKYIFLDRAFTMSEVQAIWLTDVQATATLSTDSVFSFDDFKMHKGEIQST
jgi:hypothetical protein